MSGTRHVRPLFLMSQMRSGSTLVQRVLASHSRVSTAAEPWLLLPLSYMRRTAGARAEYGHIPSAQAIGDFCSVALPHGDDDWRGALREFVLTLYGRAAEPEAEYFLDKTPHYHFIAAEIAQMFPDAKFVFLWRNPLAVVASALETFRGGRFEPYLFKQDVIDAIPRLLDARQALGDRAHAVRYEDLVGPHGEGHWRAVFEYLELDWEPQVLTDFAQVELTGQYGDPTGRFRYGTLSSQPLQKWKATFAGPVRRAWAMSLLRRLGDRRLSAMGYDPRALAEEVQSLPRPLAAAPPDLARLSLSAAQYLLRSRTLRIDEAPQPLAQRT